LVETSWVEMTFEASASLRALASMACAAARFTLALSRERNAAISWSENTQGSPTSLRRRRTFPASLDGS
jgi:hypothetical protein